MCGEDRHDGDAGEKGEGVRGGDASETHLAQRSAERTTLWAGVGVELVGEAAALAVVGLGQVGELEEKGEGARKLIGSVAGERLDAGQRVL